MENWLDRTELLIGKTALDKLKSSSIVVFGCGGVGSYVIEALIRAGIGNLIIVDNDVVDVTNINRQLIADVTTIGSSKVEIMKQRALKINPNICISTYQEFANASNFSKFIPNSCNYIIDAIDSIKSKIELVEYANNHNINIISCMGTGNKLNPSMFEVADIYSTSVCPLAKIMRKELRTRGIKNLKVVYSKEEPKNNTGTIGSISFVPSVAGLLIASEVIKELI